MHISCDKIVAEFVPPDIIWIMEIPDPMHKSVIMVIDIALLLLCQYAAVPALKIDPILLF
jgi:hypothetical protein